MSDLQPGQQLDVQPQELDSEGAGVVTTAGVQLHVAGALPGERVAAAVEHVSPHRGPGGPQAWARTLRVLSASPDRRPPACPAHGACGGCPLQHLDYDRQLEWKRRQVEQALAGVPGVERAGVQPCLASPRTLGYRNQAKYVYGPLSPGGPPVLGAFAPRSHRLVDLAGCRVVEPAIDRVAAQLRAVLAQRQVPAFDERRRTGLLRYVVLRSNAAGQVLAALVTARPLAEGQALAGELRAAAPELAGVVQSLNSDPGNVIFPAASAGTDQVLGGAGELREEIGGVAVAIGPRSFLQLNREVASQAYAAIRAFAVTRSAAGRVPPGRVLDLYAGVGAVAFNLRDRAAEVIAVEENPAATAAGERAAADAGVANLRFITADAARPMATWLPGAELVVLNPPRGGAAAASAAIAAAPPAAVAYLSCNPVSLARDLNVLLSTGHLQLHHIQPLDMLPHTPHVETLVTLTRAAAI
jgi:23S rRNA (uracil1939-C5)-methyltransferase